MFFTLRVVKGTRMHTVQGTLYSIVAVHPKLMAPPEAHVTLTLTSEQCNTGTSTDADAQYAGGTVSGMVTERAVATGTAVCGAATTAVAVETVLGAPLLLKVMRRSVTSRVTTIVARKNADVPTPSPM